MGWSRAQFYALPDDEQDFWRADDVRRQHAQADLLKQMKDVQSFDRLAATVMVLLSDG